LSNPEGHIEWKRIATALVRRHQRAAEVFDEFAGDGARICFSLDPQQTTSRLEHKLKRCFCAHPRGDGREAVERVMFRVSIDRCH
jgi:hypothetical protein